MFEPRERVRKPHAVMRQRKFAAGGAEVIGTRSQSEADAIMALMVSRAFPSKRLFT